MKKNNKGFTLVELIVVLVILAILAAILVPALLGYIDKARSSQYLEEAHSIYTAAQAYETELYAKGEANPATTFDATGLAYVNTIVSPTNVTSLTVGGATPASGADASATKHANFTVGEITTLVFTSQNGKKVEITMNSAGEWSEPVITNNP